MVGWLVSLFVCLVRCLVDWLVGWFVHWFGGLVGWLSQSDGLLVFLVGWMVWFVCLFV